MCEEKKYVLGFLKEISETHGNVGLIKRLIDLEIKQKLWEKRNMKKDKDTQIQPTVIVYVELEKESLQLFKYNVVSTPQVILVEKTRVKELQSQISTDQNLVCI